MFLPGKFPGQGSLAGYSPQGHKEVDMTEQLTLSLVLYCLFSPVVLCLRCYSATQSCLTLQARGLCTPGFPVVLYLPEFAQIHVH